MDITSIIKYLKNYNGPVLKIMEVCGTHTAAIFKSGLRSLISPSIRLISGPGCPVCVTSSAYIDRCLDYALAPGHCVLNFGDMFKVPGKRGSLAEIKSEGGRAEIMYSPIEAIEKAEKNPETTYVLAAVGFETTAPAYAFVMEEALYRGVKNIILLTALKTIAPALEWILGNERDIDGFICPGHVSVVTGTGIFQRLAEEYDKPFVVAGFQGEHLLAAIYAIVRMCEENRDSDSSCDKFKNLYPSVVKRDGNIKAQELLSKYFVAGDSTWRALGSISDSGLYLKEGYVAFDGGSRDLDGDDDIPGHCRCGDVIRGKIDPVECGLFGDGCSPDMPLGPCMVSAEGACGIWFQNR
ncbi:hydrogenase formation protein HypD [Clostridia bacterium]|nr:hydrogenase formation protein HypD [Clostridia bacterium]